MHADHAVGAARRGGQPDDRDGRGVRREDAVLGDDLLDLDHVAGLDLVLLAAGLDHRVHGRSFLGLARDQSTS